MLETESTQTDEGTVEKVLERLPDKDVDAVALAHHPNDKTVANARTLLSPLAESEGVVLRSDPEFGDYARFFAVMDGELVSVSDYGTVTGELSTGLDTIVEFAHAYSDDGETFSAELIEDAPEVLRA